MSNTNHGQGDAHALPAHRPASGLFFLCTFLLLIGIPASSYVEIWAGGSSVASGILGNGGMTMQQPRPYAPLQSAPVALPAFKSSGDAIAGDAELFD